MSLKTVNFQNPELWSVCSVCAVIRLTYLLFLQWQLLMENIAAILLCYVTELHGNGASMKLIYECC